MTLELRNVVKRSGPETHIYETRLTLGAGGFNILLGTTLSGKTTLMKLMAGLERPTAGEIWLNGKNVTAVATQQRNVSMVHQQFINYPNASVFENIASPLQVAGVSKTDIQRRVGEVAEVLRLSPMLGRRPSELSGGQQQRTALARALVKDAQLVLLDEPLANLDYKLREELRSELPKLFEHRGSIVVYATSEPLEALLLGGHTATLAEGRITHFGVTGEVYRHPVDLTTAKVFSDPPLNTVKVTKAGSKLATDSGLTWPVDAIHARLPDGAYTLGIRPHHVSPVAASPQALKVRGRVLVTELSGSESIVHFDMGFGTWISQAHGVHHFEIGASAEFYVETGRALFFNTTNALAA